MGASIMPFIFGGGATMLGSTINTMGQYAVNSDNIQAAREENQKNRDWQSLENYTAYHRNMDLMNYGSVLQNQVFKYQQDYTNQYNLPSAQVQRLYAAGLNPSAIMQNGNTGGLASPSSVSAPTVGGAQANPASVQSLPQMQNPYQGVSQMIQGVAQLYQAFTKGDLDSANADRVRSLLEGEVQLQISAIAGQQLVNEFKGLENYVFDKVKDVKVKKAFAELSTEYANALALSAEGDLYAEEALHEREKKFLTMMQHQCTSQEYLELVERVRQVKQLYRSQIALNYANAENARSQGKYADEEARREGFFNFVRDTPQVAEAFRDQILFAAEIAKNNKKISDKEYEKIKFDVEHQEINFWFEKGNQLISTILEGVGTAVGVRKVGLLQQAAGQSVESEVVHYDGKGTIQSVTTTKGKRAYVGNRAPKHRKRR